MLDLITKFWPIVLGISALLGWIGAGVWRTSRWIAMQDARAESGESRAVTADLRIGSVEAASVANTAAIAANTNEIAHVRERVSLLEAA